MEMDIILILDTDQTIGWTLKTLLETEQYIALFADSLDRAIKDFSEFQISGFITEYRIDNSTTLDAIRKLKEISPDTYVLMITDEEMEEDEYEEVMQAGVDDYFLKPMPIRKILLHLRKGLKYRSLLIEKKRLERTIETLHLSKHGGVVQNQEASPV